MMKPSRRNEFVVDAYIMSDFESCIYDSGVTLKKLWGAPNSTERQFPHSVALNLNLRLHHL